MKFPISFENIRKQDSSAFKELFRQLNSNYNIELVDSDKYLFQALYSQVFVQMKDKSFIADATEFSNHIQNVFLFELDKINKQNQNRLEIIMSNNEIKDQIIDVLSKQVYLHLSKKTSL